MLAAKNVRPAHEIVSSRNGFLKDDDPLLRAVGLMQKNTVSAPFKATSGAARFEGCRRIAKRPRQAGRLRETNNRPAKPSGSNKRPFPFGSWWMLAHPVDPVRGGDGLQPSVVMTGVEPATFSF